MAKAGIREIREHLSRYLRRVIRNHEEITITDRDQPVARLVPVADARSGFRSRKALRQSIKARGVALSELLVKARNEERA